MKILKKIIEFIVIDIMVALLLMLLAMVLLFIPGLSETIHWYSIAAAGILHFPIAITIFLVNEKNSK